ncbi:TPA: hypothetical protein LU109_003577 [Enterobacter hormaechei subsp. xiangfangensis]|nr:hypothetical protein [Enterobacter hormaechei subsp. xiangfangensis]
MKKAILALTIAATTLTAMAPAHAISEAYRRQLQREHKTQQSEIASNEITTYSDSLLEVQADGKCNVKKVNGFKPASVKHVKSDMAQVKTRMDKNITISVLKMPNACDITWMNEKTNESGILKAQ